MGGGATRKAALKGQTVYRRRLPDDPSPKPNSGALNEAYDAERSGKTGQIRPIRRTRKRAWAAVPQAVQTQAAKDLTSTVYRRRLLLHANVRRGGGRAAATGRRQIGIRPVWNERTAHADRECTVNIDMYTALLGGSIIVQTPEGDKLKLKNKARHIAARR